MDRHNRCFDHWAFRFPRIFLLGSCIAVLTGCPQHSEPIDDETSETTIGQSKQRNRSQPADLESSGVYRFRFAPGGPPEPGTSAGLQQTIRRMMELEFPAVLLEPPSGKDESNHCRRVSVRCNPLGPISHFRQAVPWCSNYTYIPSSNEIYGVDQGLIRIDSRTGHSERLLDATDYSLRAVHDSLRDELVVVTRSSFLVRWHREDERISRSDGRTFPSVSYPLAHDSNGDRFFRLDPGEWREGSPVIELHEFNAERSVVNSHRLKTQQHISLDRKDGWVSEYDALIQEGFLILIVRRMPQYEWNRCCNLCHVIDLNSGRLVFSSELIPQPTSDPPDRTESLAMTPDAVLHRASAGGRYSGLQKRIRAANDDFMHTTWRDFGTFPGTRWFGYEFPPGYYVYLYPNWYVWSSCNGRPYPPPSIGLSASQTPDEQPDSRLAQAETAMANHDAATAISLWRSIVADSEALRSRYPAAVALADYEAEQSGPNAGIRRIKELIQVDVEGNTVKLPDDLPNQFAAAILNRLGHWHRELGEYRTAAQYTAALEGTFFDTCGTYQAMYEAAARKEARRLHEWARLREFHPSKRFTRMLNGMVIASGGQAGQPLKDQLSRFDRFIFEQFRLDDNGLHFLSSIPVVKAVRTDGTLLTDQGLSAIGSMKQLEELSIPGARITDAGLQNLEGMSHLRILKLSDTLITDNGMSTVGSLRLLTHLDLSGTGITDQGLSRLAGLTRLEEFRFPSGSISGHGLSSLAKMTDLRRLDIACPSLRPGNLAFLRGLRNLESLRLHSLSGAGPELGSVSGLHTLRNLELGDPTVESWHLAPLAGLSLHQLSLRGTRCDDDCIDTLLQLPALRMLQANELRNLTPIGIRRLKHHPSLREISLTDYCIPAEQRETLRTEMRPITITYYGN